jgi:N6-L-threonylcarbamoyladenine synthase
VAINRILGLDTSNYTTSAAVLGVADAGFGAVGTGFSTTGASFDTVGAGFDTADALFENGAPLRQAKRLLPVKPGDLGLRQSDALFHHEKQLPEILRELFSNGAGQPDTIGGSEKPDVIGVSTKPRNIEGSYMPCFLAGESLADSMAAVYGSKVYKTSHQVGHILSALYAADRLDLTRETFAAFHISGGTTDMLLCSPSDELLINCEQISGSADLKAGQLIDRVGVMLGLQFPCGRELEKLAVKFQGKLPNFKIAQNADNYCFSGAQNICEKMHRDGVSPEKIAAYVISYIGEAISLMIKKHLPEGVKTILFCGGVMSDKLIQNALAASFSELDLIFTPPEFSCDNAVGAAVFAAIKSGSLYV